MAQQASFDITSTVDLQEVDNAVNQAKKELAQRYDFKGSQATIEFRKAESAIDLLAEDKFRMDALYEILQTRLIRRGVPPKNAKLGEVQPAGGSLVKATIELQQGIPTDTGRAIVKFLKDAKLKKVQAAIQADQVRVTSPSKDDLQTAMRVLKEHDFGIDLQFGNYRS